MSKQASELFQQLVCSGNGTIVTTCNCGRTHFATFGNESGFFEAGELEDLRAKAKADPTKYIEWCNTSSIGFGQLNGVNFVWDCPCGGMKIYEDLFWSHRHLIAEYFKLRANAELAQTNADLSVAHKAKMATKV